MSSVKHYGETVVEQETQETLVCRQIVRTINDFGVTEDQRLRLIYMLSLELVNRDHMLLISDVVKRCESGNAKKSTLITQV